ncbi:reverse transcriptase [Lasius niger]|uniref:Reverse transcriptase n=1 Tax=Lasius niger TaxID=67767 RepID=A0A0J7KS96_LASNI|nr:reverse transcriptase [Lasius niger]
MPNLRDPDERRRRLFANVVYSVILYGAPVWGDPSTLRRAQVKLTGLERSIAQRVISAYRTVSGSAALLLARLPPMRFAAPMRRRVFLRFKELREGNEYTKERKKAVKELEFLNMCEQWRAYLERPNTPGEFTKMAIVPRLEAWLMRGVGSISFHLTQLMTGHGCFGNFSVELG